ncbi:uncharacterized protein UDID_18383 [Ustilago sp. UG-2017a]|nr:uncharacterized protein UDID_18383 [Ustilago sp. UG-2017a]
MSTGDSAVRCIHVKGGGGRSMISKHKSARSGTTEAGIEEVYFILFFKKRFYLLVVEGMLEARVVSSSNSKRGCVSEDEKTENSKEDVPVFSVPVGFLYLGKQEVSVLLVDWHVPSIEHVRRAGGERTPSEWIYCIKKRMDRRDAREQA